MGNNYHTAYSNVAPKTAFTVAAMGAPLAALDTAITYAKKALVGCDGALSYVSATGVLTWSGTIHIYFNTAAGLTVHNTIAAGNVTLADSQFAYVTLNETNATALTAAVGNISLGAASAFLAYNILVLGYRNAVDNRFYPVNLPPVWESASELTIASGVIAVTQPTHTVDTESDAASDDLVTINGGVNGQMLVIRAAHTDRTVVIKNGTGNIETGGGDISLDSTSKGVLLNYDGALSKWVLIGSSNMTTLDLAAPGAIGETTPGTIRGKNKEIFKTQSADSPLTVAECAGTIVSNYGMTDADCIIDLPPAEEGLSFVAILPAVRARYFKFHCPTAQSDKIYLSGVAGSDDGYVGVNSGYATGASASFFTFKSADGGYDWFCIPIFGTWEAS